MKGMLAGLFILIMIVVGAVGFVMITNEYASQYTTAVNDTVNNSVNLSSYQSVSVISKGVDSNLGIAVMMGLLLVAVLLILMIKGALEL
jgi:hypothetical protein